MQKNILIILSLIVCSLSFTMPIHADGCYICQGKPDTFVKFTGFDNFDKRKKAEACGCRVGGTTSSCAAANQTILCEVSRLFSMDRYLSFTGR